MCVCVPHRERESCISGAIISGALTDIDSGWPPLLYRGTSLARKCTPPGPYRRPMPRVQGGS